MSDITETEAPDPRFKTTMMLRDERDRRLRETDHWAYQDRPTMTRKHKLIIAKLLEI